MVNFTTWRSLVDGAEYTGIPDSVVNHWPTDEGSGTVLTDNVGNIDGSISGPAWTSLSDAVGDYYLSYDGSDDLVSLGQDTLNAVYSGDWTFTAFVKPSSTGSYKGVLGHYDGSTGTRVEMDSNDNLALTYDGVSYVPSTLSMAADTWYFIAVRYDSSASVVDFRLNDTEDNGNSLSNPVNSTGADWTIGFSRSGYFWDGGIDEATFADSYLSDSDIQTLRDRRSDI